MMSLGHGDLLDSLLAVSAHTFGLSEMQERFLDEPILCVTYLFFYGIEGHAPTPDKSAICTVIYNPVVTGFIYLYFYLLRLTG